MKSMKRKTTKAAKAAKALKRTGSTAAGREIIASLTELAEVLEAGVPMESRFTVRNVQMPDDPAAYTAAAVRATRDKLNMSQIVFSRLLGVSYVLVQAWEGGKREPQMWARRMLDEMNANPSYWRAKVMSRAS